MSYLVLARKWRPKTFDDIIGQDNITQTLKNSISTGKIAHALVFSGTRGVGKTTSARIVAKALNCINGPTPSPCSECSFCRDISDGKSLDVMEIDAASHTGVGDVREIIENIKYLPSSGKTKIYIIDEAHMLSHSAFNALLKTLEEPPPRVLFILATTESHKIPTTILSRCQRYEFKKVPTDVIRARLEFIAKEEEINISGDALSLIAGEADGSMRDALSLFDRLIATFGDKIERADAEQVLGVMDRSLTRAAVSAIFSRDPKLCVETLNAASDKGVSPRRFAEEILKAMRTALMIKICGADSVSDISEEEKDEIRKLSSRHGAETLQTLFNLTLEGAEQVQRSHYSKIALEAAMVKLCLVKNVIPLDDILAKIEALQVKVGTSGSGNRVSDVPPRGRSDESLAEAEAKYHATEERETAQNSETSGRGDFISFVKPKSAMAGIHLEKAAGVRVEGGALVVEFAGDSVHSNYVSRNQESVKALAKEFFGEDLRLKIEITAASGKGGNLSPSERSAQRKEEAERDPVVQNTLNIFEGRVVKITNTNKE